MTAATAEAVPDLMVDSFRDAARALRRPFTVAAVKFKVQATWPKESPTSGLIVAYIDARLVVERLNLLVPHLWYDAYRPTGNGQMWCDLTVDGITRSDVGEGQGKGLVSDALKRAAVKFGIGVSLYAIPKMILGTDDGALKQKMTQKGLTLELKPKGEQILRGMYEHWLEQSGRQAFGEPLDHGDVEGAQGDPEAAETAEEAEPAAAPAAEPEPEVIVGEPVIDTERAAAIAVATRERGMTFRQIAGLITSAGVKEIVMTKDGLETALRALTHDQASDVERQLQNVQPIQRTETT